MSAYPIGLVKHEEYHSDLYCNPVPHEYPAHNAWTNSSYPPQLHYHGQHWECVPRCRSPEYYFEPVKASTTAKYIMIQPRNSEDNSRDHRMFVPITKKRKGNNRYGQSGSHRCQRCQKGKRKCVYGSKDEPCQRCSERGFTDCGEKLPTPRKQAALRMLQENGYLLSDSDESSRQSTSEYPVPQSSPAAPLLPPPNLDALRSYTSGNPADEALYKLWKHLTI